MLLTVNEAAVYIGDINLDLSKDEHSDIVHQFNAAGLSSMLNLKATSTNLDSHIDVCFSDKRNLDCWYYESYCSYHKPICIIWPK